MLPSTENHYCSLLSIVSLVVIPLCEIRCLLRTASNGFYARSAGLSMTHSEEAKLSHAKCFILHDIFMM